MPGSSSMSRVRFTSRLTPGAAAASRAVAGVVRGFGDVSPSGPAASTVNVLPWRRRALHGDLSGVRLDDPLHEAEAEAGALDLRRDDVGRAVERIEDLRLVGGGDADAAIGHADSTSPPAEAARDADPAAVGAVLDRVADQVLEHAPERRLVAGDRRQVVGDVELDRDAGGCAISAADADTTSRSSAPIAPAAPSSSAGPTGGRRTRESARRVR